MVANLRCNELKEEAIEKVKADVQALQQEASERKLNDFSARCRNILKTTSSHYEEFAHQYDQKVFKKIREELLTTVLSNLFISFDSQLKMIRHEIFEKFDKEIRKLSIKEQVNENFYQATERLFEEYTSQYKRESSGLVIENAGWSSQVTIHEADVTQQLRSLINNAREKEIDKLQVLTQTAAKNNIEEIINTPIYELNPTFWEEIRVPYLNELRDIASNSEEVLKVGFKASWQEVEDFIQTLESSIHSQTVEIVKRLFRDINTNLLRKFNKLFKKDENGKNREWRQIEEGTIREMHTKFKSQMEEVIGEFKYMKLPKAALSSTPAPGELSQTPMSGIQRSMTIQYARLLSEQDINRVRDKFNEDAEFVLEEAIRKHHNL